MFRQLVKSNIKDLGYFNSIGGSALKVGSVKVSTVNLARIAYECAGKEKKFLDILKDKCLWFAFAQDPCILKEECTPSVLKTLEVADC